jgi:hypothetical protein
MSTVKNGCLWLLAAALAAAAGNVVALGDWKSDFARKAVGSIAQEAIEEAVEDELKDAAFDTLGADLSQAGRDYALRRTAIGSEAGRAIGAAMTAADVADSMDDALEAAEAVRKINKARKAIQRVR